MVSASAADTLHFPVLTTHTRRSGRGRGRNGCRCKRVKLLVMKIRRFIVFGNRGHHGDPTTATSSSSSSSSSSGCQLLLKRVGRKDRGHKTLSAFDRDSTQGVHDFGTDRSQGGRSGIGRGYIRGPSAPRFQVPVHVGDSGAAFPFQLTGPFPGRA